MDGWMNQSIRHQVFKQALPHAENRALKTREISQNIVQESNNKPEEDLLHHITSCPREPLHWANYLRWQWEWKSCCWTPCLPIINRVGFLAIGNVENWVNKPTVSFKSLAKRVLLKTSSSRKSRCLVVMSCLHRGIDTEVCRARRLWLHHQCL